MKRVTSSGMVRRPTIRRSESTRRAGNIDTAKGISHAELSGLLKFSPQHVSLPPALSPHAEENQQPVEQKISTQRDVAVQATEDPDTAAVIDKLKKSAFVNIAIAVALGLFLVAAVAAAVISGGLAIPVAAMAGVAVAVAVADAGTALYNWRSKAGGREELPMKGDSIGNLYYLVGYCIKSVTGNKHELSDQAKNYIRYASGVSRFLIGISSIALGSINTVIMANTIAVSTMIGPASTSLARSLMECINLFLFVNSSAPAAPKHMEARNRRDEHGTAPSGNAPSGIVPSGSEETPAAGS